MSNEFDIQIETREVDKVANRGGFTAGTRTGKYDSIFDSMKVGQCVKVPAKQGGNIRQAMQGWLRRVEGEDAYRIVTRTDADEGVVRIWLLEREADEVVEQETEEEYEG